MMDWHEHIMRYEEIEDADNTIQGFQGHPATGGHDRFEQSGMVNQSIDVLGMGPGDAWEELPGHEPGSL
jgi:hypothetical protein